ncbi:MAG: hypothetical protein RRA45_01550 [Saccharolobus sp.]|jgi:hypothetical protein|uniref:hypothetical protein n=1 Tax=Saccharolobus sp. TaxID=2100761 RepID=UPI0028CECB2C|nr:hypothetical protein [Saccharolobus sp.]MDT7860889.1 hypothetical protein [Saccharolobus sp.]
MSELDFLLKKRKNIEENKNVEEIKNETKENANNNTDKIKNEMKKFLERDPKIGVWSYPAFLVLQYLYHTIPGFKMSRVAKEALERGLKEMYPELFEIAVKITEEKFK